MIVSAVFAVNSSLYFRLAKFPEVFEWCEADIIEVPALTITVKIIASLDKFANDFLFVFVELHEHCVSPCVVCCVLFYSLPIQKPNFLKSDHICILWIGSVHIVLFCFSTIFSFYCRNHRKSIRGKDLKLLKYFSHIDELRCVIISITQTRDADAPWGCLFKFVQIYHASWSRGHLNTVNNFESKCPLSFSACRASLRPPTSVSICV